MDETALFKKLSENLRAQGYYPQLFMENDGWKCMLANAVDPHRQPPQGYGISVLLALNDAISMKLKREQADREAAAKRKAG